MATIDESLAALGIAANSLSALAGDASQRRFYRACDLDGGGLVVAVYPEGAEAQARRDQAVQCWGWAHGLPIPRPLGWHGLVVASEDLGDLDLERAAAAGQPVIAPALAALAAFQRCEWRSLTTAPFDARLFRQELAVFERHACGVGRRLGGESAAFLDELAERLVGHPYRLTHRDFHVNNLFFREGTVRAVDFQDMRGGPDTYDLVSLFRERAGAALAVDDAFWLSRAAGELGWTSGWRQRYLECAAQRGLKVVGTFLRLSAAGRPGYLVWLPAVRANAAAALSALHAPTELVAMVAAPIPGL